MRPEVQIFCALIWNLLAAGPVFGFAALKPILIDQGVYRDLCVETNPNNSCSAQDLRLNLMFTVAAAVTNFMALLVGVVLDTKGPRVCGLLGSGFLALGALLLANSSSINSIDPYISGYVALAIGGPFVFISTFQLANAVPQHSGKILAALTGAFDVSSALFMIYRIINEKFKPISLHTFFTIYLCVPVFIMVCQILIMPTTSYQNVGVGSKLEAKILDEDGGGFSDEVHSGDSNEEQPDEAIPRRYMNGSGTESVTESATEDYVDQNLSVKTEDINGIMHGKNVKTQVMSAWFIYITILTIICMLRLNYFMATVRSQEDFLLKSSELAERVGAIFDIALPVGGVLAIPLIGIILDSVPTIAVMKLVSIMSVFVGVLGLFPNFYANVTGILIFVVYRPFYYTVVSDYCSKVFGFETFGIVYGLVVSISGVLNLSQTVVDRITHSVFNMDPTPMNLILTTSTAIVSALLVRFMIIEFRIWNRTSHNDSSNLPNESAIIE